MRYREKLTKNILTLFTLYHKAVGNRKGGTPPVLSKRVAKDSGFYRNLRDGGNFTVRKYDTVVANLAAIWPSGTPWPHSIPLPDPGDADITPREEDNENG